MVCAPIIAIVEIATSGALSAAIGSALGSQILGGAVLGLIASGGKPEGALLGGLGAAFSGALGGAAGEAAEAGVDAVSNTSQLATDTVANHIIEGSADDLAREWTMGADDASKWASGSNASGASSAAKAAGVERTAADVLKSGTPPFNPNTPGGTSIMQRVEGIAKEYPTLTKIGMGMIQGIGNQLGQESLMQEKYRLADEMAQNQQRRAYSGVNTDIGFRPSNNGYQSPLQRYLNSTGATR